MLRERQQEHKFDDKKLAALYNRKEAEIREYLDMLGYAEEYLKNRGKTEQYGTVDDDEFAFRQIGANRKKVPVSNVSLYKELAYLLIDKPEGGRVYQDVADVAKYIAPVSDAVAPDLTQKDDKGVDKGSGGELLGEAEAPIYVGNLDSYPEERKDEIRSLVRETIATRKGLEKDKKRSDFVLTQIKRANASLAAAVGGITDGSEKLGVRDQLDEIDRNAVRLRDWAK